MGHVRVQGRRIIPKGRTRRQARRAPEPSAALSLGDLIAAAYDALGDTRAVARVLGSDGLALRLGCRIVVG